jgi:hypothetical protein
MWTLLPVLSEGRQLFLLFLPSARPRAILLLAVARKGSLAHVADLGDLLSLISHISTPKNR